MSDLGELTRMANQIADFFKGYPEGEAVAGIAGHLRDFWTLAMRAKLAAHVAAGGAGLSPLVVRAVQSLQTELA